MTKDIHGRDRIAKNTLINWFVLAIKFISGFILPRLVSDNLGQDILGIWDFCWSIVGYFELITGGVISSINRYIARFHASKNYEELNIFVSTAGYVVRGMSLLVLMISLSFLLIPVNAFDVKFSALWQIARYPIFILGLGITVQISASIYNGILTGFHRWDIHNGIQIGTLILFLVSSITALKLGGGLVTLALVTVGSEFIGRICQIFAARKIYPDFKMKWNLFRFSMAKKMLIFGSKTYILVISRLISTQTVSIFIGGWLGPSLLAVFSRPQSLLRQISHIIEKYAMLLVPTISSLQTSNEIVEIKKITILSMHLALCISLPSVLLLFFLGGDVLTLWMGKSYSIELLITIIAIGSFFEMTSVPLYRILMGMNLHGRLVLINLISSIFTAIAAYILIVQLHRGIIAIAFATSIPIIIGQGIVVPLLFSKTLHFQVLNFFTSIWTKPLICSVPFAIYLFFVKRYAPVDPFFKVIFALSGGVILLGISYWIGIVPASLKKKLGNKFKRIIIKKLGDF